MNKEVQNDLCRCGHERKHHGKSSSINYTEGKCRKCDCEHFVMPWSEVAVNHKKQILKMIDRAIGMLDTLRIDINLKPTREGLNDQASDLNILLCQIHDQISSADLKPITEEKITIKQFERICKALKGLM